MGNSSMRQVNMQDFLLELDPIYVSVHYKDPFRFILQQTGQWVKMLYVEDLPEDFG